MVKKKTPPTPTVSKRQLFTLPPRLVDEIETYANIVRNGNKSGFVADAIQAYIKSLRKARHTQRLRQSYAASAELSRAIAEDWGHLDGDAWDKLDKLESRQ